VVKIDFFATFFVLSTICPPQMFDFLLIISTRNATRRICSMEKYPEELCDKMREIFKTIIKRIVDTGKTEESDMLFIRLYKTEFEQTTNYKEQVNV
jgi:hypothetical protein